MEDGHILTDSMFMRRQMNIPRKEVLQYAIDEVMVGFENMLKK